MAKYLKDLKTGDRALVEVEIMSSAAEHGFFDFKVKGSGSLNSLPVKTKAEYNTLLEREPAIGDKYTHKLNTAKNFGYKIEAIYNGDWFVSYMSSTSKKLETAVVQARYQDAYTRVDAE